MIAAMPGLPALSIALRYLAYGVLIAVMLIKPALAFATEIGELAAPAGSAWASATPTAAATPNGT